MLLSGPWLIECIAMRVGRVVAVLAVVLVAGCSGSSETPPGEPGDAVPVPGGLDAGCPTPDTSLRFPAGDLRAGPVAVRLCPGQPTIAYTGDPIGSPIEAPVDELTVGVEALVELVNRLPEWEQGSDCTFDDGPHHVYWFRYADGDARAVAYDEGGCHTAVVGENLARERGEELATAFASALLAQRAAQTPPEHGAEALQCPVPPLSEPLSVLPSVPLTMTAATWCVGTGPSKLRMAPLPPGLLERVNAGLLGAPTEQQDRCPLQPYASTLEGITAWGDRVSYLVPGCRVVGRTGYGRDNIATVYEANAELLAAIRSLRLGPVQRWKTE